MAKERGLGKGLTALLEENDVTTAAEMLPVLEIEPNAEQPRKRFDEAALAELTESVAAHGVLQPILVRPLARGGYQLVAGERRWRAARNAGLTEIPAVVREMSEREAAELAIIENLQREDLNPMEEALGYRALMDNYQLTQEQAAEAVGKSRPAVTNALRLLTLPEEVAEMVASGRLSAGHARAILSARPEAQVVLAKNAVKKGWSVREVERRAKAVDKAEKIERGEAFGGHPIRKEVELALTEALGRRVKVLAGDKERGQLMLEFYSDKDLRDLANRITR